MPTVQNIKIGLRVAIGHAFKNVQRMKRAAKRNPEDTHLISVARDQLREMMATYSLIDAMMPDTRVAINFDLFQEDIRAEALKD